MQMEIKRKRSSNFISDKKNLKTVTRHKAIINIYTPNIGASQYANNYERGNQQ